MKKTVLAILSFLLVLAVVIPVLVMADLPENGGSNILGIGKLASLIKNPFVAKPDNKAEKLEREECEVHRWGAWHIMRHSSCVPGLAYRYCLKCYKREYQSIPPFPFAEHAWTDWEVVQFPTCEDPGDKYRHCTNEGCTAEEHASVGVLPHVLGPWKIIKEPTCTEDGKTARICESCGNIIEQKQEPKALGHKWGEWELIEPSTCSTFGQRRHKCERCGQIEDEVIPMSTDHKWGEWKIIKAATDKEKGLKERECILCHKKETRAIPVKTVKK